MILQFGDMSPYPGLHWYMVEMRSERTIESVLRRLGQALPNLFRDSAVEIFIPVSKRDLHTFELNTGTYLYARSPHFSKLLRLKSITGVVALATLGESGNPAHAIKLEDSFVQEQIALSEAAHLAKAEQIEVGSFVRILDGDMRDWCGHVTNIHDGLAIVKVEIKTKILLIETPVRNLIDKSDVPDCLRVFYYSDLVEGLRVQDLEALVSEDLNFEEDAAYTDDGLDAQQPKKHSRQQTVTALVKRLIVTGTHDPAIIGGEVLKALKAGILKRPKNLLIVHGIIKNGLIENFFQHTDLTIKNYRQVIERFGEQYRFSLQDLARIDPEIGIPLTTEGEPSTQEGCNEIPIEV